MNDPNAVATPVRAEHRSFRPSLVWLAPLLALAISLGIAWNSYSSRGPIVEIVLNSAAGIEAQKTLLKHKDVEIGTVEDIGFTDDLKKVKVAIRVDNDLAPYFDGSAQFWIVRPEVSARGITGLDTVLSGPYIEVDWDGTKGDAKRSYVALIDRPLSRQGERGLRLRLRANDGGSMVAGAPILYKRIEVGRIESKELSADGERVDFSIFIDAPHDSLISTATRFWDLSGVAVEIGTEGAKLKVDSLASLLQGGISFDTVATEGGPVNEMQSFILYGSEPEARRSIFSDDPNSQVRLSVEFQSSVRGLKIGAPVEYRGLRVGEVTDVAAKIRRNLDGVNDISLIVTIVIAPTRLGLNVADQDESIAFLKRSVTRGLRAQLKSASLLTGALYVELVEQPDAPIAILDELEEPYPRLPSVPSDFEDFTASAEGVLTRINALPIEELLYSANDLLRNLNALATADGTTALPDHLSGLLVDARAVVNDPNVKKVPEDLAATLAAAREVMEEIKKAGVAAALVTALEDASNAAKAISTVAEGVPALVTTATKLSGNLAELPLDQLVASATKLLDDADKIATAEGIAEIPANLNASLVSIRTIMTELEEAKVAATLASTLSAARDTAKAISSASEGLPTLISSATSVTNDLQNLKLEELVAAATKLIADADKVVSAEGITDIPENLNESLVALRTIMSDIREANSAKTLEEALVAAREAAKAVTAASVNIPSMVATMSGIADNVNGLPIEDLVLAATNLVQNADKLVASDGMKAAPQALADTLQAARDLLVDLRDAEAAKNLSEALQAARDAATSISKAAASTPKLIERFERIAANVEELPLDQLLASTQSLVEDANKIIASDGLQAVPQALSDTLNAARALMVDLQRAETAQKLAGALDAARVAAQSFSSATADVPALAQSLTQLANKANALPIEGLLASATLLVQDADRLIASQGVQQLPTSLTSAIDQVRSLVIELRQSGTATNVNGALVSVAQAGQSFQSLSQNLSVLIPKLVAVAETADSVLSSVDVGSELNYEAATALREVRDAARAITGLAATVERRPNSLILGK